MRPFSLFNATPDRVVAILSKIAILPDAPDECWLWKGAKNNNGYGIIQQQGRLWIAHRTVYYLFYQRDPKDLLVCHKCDVRLCCNPKHLFLGTHDDNQKDMAQKGRAASGDKNSSRKHPHLLPRGSQHRRSKLTEAQVTEIRDAYATGRIFQRELARQFGVSQGLIQLIISGKIWTHLPVPQGVKYREGRRFTRTRFT